MPQALVNPLLANIDAAIAQFRELRCLAAPLGRAAELVVNCLSRGHKVLTCGNGGSAAEAAHLATEFVCRYCDNRPPFPAICLSDAGSTLTAICNDYDAREMFARQISAFARSGDVLVAFSTSGRSPNVTHALQRARELKLASVAFLGRDGGECRSLATVELLVPGSATVRIQEAHLLLLHSLCEMVEPALKDPARVAAGFPPIAQTASPSEKEKGVRNA